MEALSNCDAGSVSFRTYLEASSQSATSHYAIVYPQNSQGTSVCVCVCVCVCACVRVCVVNCYLLIPPGTN